MTKQKLMDLQIIKGILNFNETLTHDDHFLFNITMQTNK